MIKQDKKTYLEEEAFVILNSGEIPEVTLHESLYYLTEDPEGPGLKLTNKDIQPLKEAVVGRYRAIILRDLEPDNRDKTVYRGLARCLANWRRLEKFCRRENLDLSIIREEAGAALRNFLENEAAEMQNATRISGLNCSDRGIETLAGSLGLSLDDLPAGWRDLCLVARG